MGILFLFGAGASFGSGPCHPSNPPLGKDLLLEMRNEGGVAGTIHGDLLEAFVQDPEKGMVKFFEERNGDTTPLLKQMSAFLAKYSISEGNLYIELINIIKKRKSITFATTNYDLLIEQAISYTGHMIQYHAQERARNNIPLLKIHGSVNFIPRANFTNCTFILPPHGKASVIDCEVDVMVDSRQIIEYCNSKTALSPAVAMYHPDKPVLHCPSFVKMQQEDFKTEIKKSSKIFIIGLKINPDDTHIWGELENCKADIHIIDIDSTATEAWKAKLKKKNIYHSANSFEKSLHVIKSILRI
ncbi:SIR2 family protein [Enterobacter hormaechei]|uniref:SIR2 family protein n=1 Tax=Enterobacter hormaechei TaxID=158836 RepID=UPI001867B95C|nr:SIR2 family protein [Enterobacter hormaechei]